MENGGNKEVLSETAFCKEIDKGTEQDINRAIDFDEQAECKEKAEWCKKKKSENISDIDFLGYERSFSIDELVNFHEHENYSIPTFEEQKSNNTEGEETLGDLNVEKVIGNTDIKYNICTFGSKFHIGFGVQVTIEINGKIYECKTHNSVKGRIDGMKKLFTENDIKLGDCIEAYYYKEKNRVVLIKK